jgi:hypothetical protein
MEILISFTTTVGVVEALRTTKDVAVDVVNQSIVLWLKNKKFPSPDENTPINNRDTNRRYPPFGGLPGQSAYLLTRSSRKRYSSYYDLYLSDNGTPSWYFAIYRPYGKFTIQSNSSDPGAFKYKESIVAEPLDPGLINLHPFYYASLGYTVGGGSATFEISGTNPVGAPLKISESTYRTSYSNRSSSSSSYSSNAGTDSRYGKPYSNSNTETSSGTVYFA